VTPKTWQELLDQSANRARDYTFDNGLVRAFPKERSRRKREQLHREFWRYAIRHDHAINSGKKQPDESTPYPSEATVTQKIEDDKQKGLSAFMVEDMSRWREMQIKESRRASGRLGGEKTVERREEKKGKQT